VADIHRCGEVSVLKEFRKFIERGNVVDLAVAVILGAAFGAVVKSLTEHILMPLIAVITGGDGPSFDYSIVIRDKEILWGAFLTEAVNFVIIAFAIFVIVKAFERARNLRQKDEVVEEAALTEVELLQEIRDLLADRSATPAASSPSRE
jgi:large conductance mechanosensitive channel